MLEELPQHTILALLWKVSRTHGFASLCCGDSDNSNELALDAAPLVTSASAARRCQQEWDAATLLLVLQMLCERSLPASMRSHLLI